MSRSRSRCVVYMRVSTAPQALGDGLMRQLETCIQYARDNRMNIAAVFADVCSGDSDMPRRQLAYVSSVTMNCPILVESRDRWSRMGYGMDPLSDANVVFTSPAAIEFEDTCKQIIADAIRASSR